MKLFVLTLSLTSALLFVSCTRTQGTPDSAATALHNAYNTGYDDKAPEPSAKSRRLESVTWNSVRHELTWEVSKGTSTKEPDADSTYKPMAKDRYQIDMDNATMTFNGKTRRFSETEAENVRALMDVISRYAVESTIWWEQGQGEPLDDHGKPLNPEPKTRDKPKTVGAPGQIVKLTGTVEQLAALLQPPVPGSAESR